MSLYKRKDSPHWWVKLSHCRGRVQKSTGTSNKRKAQELHDHWKTQLWEQERLGVKPRHIWDEAVVRWLAESMHKATIATYEFHFRWLQPHLEGMDLSAITRDTVEQLIEAGLAEGVKNATINRRSEAMRAVLRKAMNDWEWIDRVPNIRILAEPSRRVRFLTREEAQRLFVELPPHLRAMAQFTLSTGLRQGNVKGLLWSQIDLQNRRAWIHADQAKARKAIPVPLTDAAVAVLRGQLGKHSTHVFTYHGLPVTQVGTKAWRHALERAGISDFRWHDLRHTWASWHAQAGTPMHVLQELGAWESSEMVRRYAHLSVEHLSGYADRFATHAALGTLNEGYELATSKELH